MTLPTNELQFLIDNPSLHDSKGELCVESQEDDQTYLMSVPACSIPDTADVVKALATQRIADAKRIAELEAAQVTVQEAARVLLGVFEDPEANAPQRFDWQSMYQEMTRDHNESMEICGTHDWPQTLVVALRAIAGHP